MSTLDTCTLIHSGAFPVCVCKLVSSLLGLEMANSKCNMGDKKDSVWVDKESNDIQCFRRGLSVENQAFSS